MKVTSAIVGACLVASAIMGVASAAPHTTIDVIEPPLAGGGAWDRDRMRDARERVKDILPGHRP